MSAGVQATSRNHLPPAGVKDSRWPGRPPVCTFSAPKFSITFRMPFFHAIFRIFSDLQTILASFWDPFWHHSPYFSHRFFLASISCRFYIDCSSISGARFCIIFLQYDAILFRHWFLHHLFGAFVRIVGSFWIPVLFFEGRVPLSQTNPGIDLGPKGHPDCPNLHLEWLSLDFGFLLGMILYPFRDYFGVIFVAFGVDFTFLSGLFSLA